MRLFIALQLPLSIKDELIKIQETFRHNRRRGNLTTPNNLHLTLAFIGEVDAERFDRVIEVLESVPMPPLTLTLDQVGFFHRKDGAVWWVGLQPHPQLLHFQKALIAGLRGAEIPYDPKPFNPHITMVRNYSPMHEPVVLPRVNPLTFTSEAVTLMRSHRVNEALVYTPLAVFMAQEDVE